MALLESNILHFQISTPKPTELLLCVSVLEIVSTFRKNIFYLLTRNKMILTKFHVPLVLICIPISNQIIKIEEKQ